MPRSERAFEARQSFLCHGTRAFTFVEVLAAMLFMAIVIPVTVQGLLFANRIGENGARKLQAAELADRMLTEMIVSEAWRDGDQTGDFGTENAGYRWRLTTEAWPSETLRLVTVEVEYPVQGGVYTERLSTLADEYEAATESQP